MKLYVDRHFLEHTHVLMKNTLKTLQNIVTTVIVKRMKMDLNLHFVYIHNAHPVRKLVWICSQTTCAYFVTDCVKSTIWVR